MNFHIREQEKEFYTMRSNYNIKDFEDEKEMYLYFHNFILDRSGRCDIGLTDDMDFAAGRSSTDRIYRITLEEIPLKNTVELVEVKRKTVGM